MILATHPYAAQGTKRLRKGPCDLLWRSQVLVLIPMFGFVQCKIERAGRKVETDNYVMIGSPNGGGFWQEF